ncbi:hypothetical protein FA95DRAFT_1553254 [Auriscalpium vulgare]|uniref:Uncharacterized protein n=1 Tax=Auriscalpium vulgare TaxID=40419 RepID=A0ACB8S9G7_9AGAM|nr:hypothetical protein FA95DRAFT_1553254 [Auriscalpium vulgare]
MAAASRPIVIVTGANNGVGFGICRRLLFQLSQPRPSDANPLFESTTGLVSFDPNSVPASGPEYPCQGLTLIMACRNRQRAETARTELLRLFEEDVKTREKQQGEAAHVEVFRKNLTVTIHSLDLASVHSVFEFSTLVSQNYPYVSHVFCNAGVANFDRISWPLLFRQIVSDLLGALTNPRFNLQKPGILSEDGFGWVWQCNVFGHFILVRALDTLFGTFEKVSHAPARVIWTSSLESRADKYDSEDWQLAKTLFPYEGSKYQMDIIRAELDRRALRSPSPTVRHFTFHPGVVSTSIDQVLLGPFLHKVKLLVFYMARFLGSPHHNITLWNGAAAGVHLALVSLVFIPVLISSSTSQIVKASAVGQEITPVRFNSETDRRGNGRVGVSPVAGWAEHDDESEKLVNRCERLYQSLLTADGKSVFTAT